MDELWGRQRKESIEAFEAFKLYRDLENERSYSRVASKLGKSNTLISRWGSTWNWQERTEAYDSFMDRQKVAARIKARTAMIDRICNQAMLLQGRVIDSIQKIQAAAALPGARPMTAHELTRMFQVAARIEMDARGGPVDDNQAAVVEYRVHVYPEGSQPPALGAPSTSPEAPKA